jgi:two-component system NtrC family sensor kinase
MEKDALERAYQREKRARKRAEEILEEKARDIYQQNRELEAANLRMQEQQQELVQAEKGMAMGTLVAGVIHEVNNPLAFVISNTSVLNRLLHSMAVDLDMENDPRVLEAADLMSDIREGLNRIEATINDLRSYSHVSKATRELIDLIKIVDSSIKFAESRIPPEVKISVLSSTPVHVVGNSNELVQVVSNLLINAAQSSETPPEVSIEIEQDEELAKIHVQDTGDGIPDTVLEKIFDPFFTTKEIGKGTGMGLPVVTGIINKHGGSLHVETEPGVGSLFSVYLPLASKSRRN